MRSAPPGGVDALNMDSTLRLYLCSSLRNEFTAWLSTRSSFDGIQGCDGAGRRHSLSSAVVRYILQQISQLAILRLSISSLGVAGVSSLPPRRNQPLRQDADEGTSPTRI